jgi:hypothetical protein
MIQKSFDLRKQSKNLLKYSIEAVEIAIEQTEEIAIKFLDEKVKDLKSE